jgi:YgiT-type zinc finger domain-containing protein
MGMSSLRKTGSRGQPKVGETCCFCGRGILEEKRVTVDFRWGDRLVIIESVLAKVCNECGERYSAAKAVREMERIAKEEHKERELSVPVVALE